MKTIVEVYKPLGRALHHVVPVLYLFIRKTFLECENSHLLSWRLLHFGNLWLVLSQGSRPGSGVGKWYLCRIAVTSLAVAVSSSSL